MNTHRSTPDAARPATVGNDTELTVGQDVDRTASGDTEPTVAAVDAGGRRGLLRRAGWNLVDQVLSALTNVTTAILVVHAAGAKAFDAFSVVFLLFATMIGIERALVGQPLGIRHSSDSGAVRRQTVSRALGLVVGITVPASLLMLVAGMLLGGRLGSTLIATSLVLPFLILQDACRQAFFAAGDAKKAAANDALWAVVQFSLMGVLIAAGAATAASLVLAWGGSAAVCVMVALVQLGALPRPQATVSWLREHRDLVPYFLGEYLLSTGAFNGGYLTVGALIGDQAVGSIRAAQVLLGPLQIVASAGMSFGLPELSRRAAHVTNPARRRIALATTTFMALLSTVYATLLFSLPDGLGRLLFQDKWFDAQAVLLPLALAMVLSTSALGPSMVIYALGQARRTFRILTVEAPLVFTLMIVGTLLYRNVAAAAWGQFVDQAVVILLWYGTLQRVLATLGETSGPHGRGRSFSTAASARPTNVISEPAARESMSSTGPGREDDELAGHRFEMREGVPRQGLRVHGGVARPRYGLPGAPLELRVDVDGALMGQLPAADRACAQIGLPVGDRRVFVSLMHRGMLLHQQNAIVKLAPGDWATLRCSAVDRRHVSRRRHRFSLTVVVARHAVEPDR